MKDDYATLREAPAVSDAIARIDFGQFLPIPDEVDKLFDVDYQSRILQKLLTIFEELEKAWAKNGIKSIACRSFPKLFMPVVLETTPSTFQ